MFLLLSRNNYLNIIILETLRENLVFLFLSLILISSIQYPVSSNKYPVMNIKLTAEEKKLKIVSAADVNWLMQRVLNREEKIDRMKEHFWLLGLNLRKKLLFLELVSMGSVDSTTVKPMNVFQVAVIKGAVSVIFVHNHPSGEVDPSGEDKNVTDRLIQVGKVLDIEVCDHLIISLKKFKSFDEIGLMKELSASMEWVPKFAQIEKIKEEHAKLLKEAVDIAKYKAFENGEKQGRKIGFDIGMERGFDCGEISGIEKGKKEENIKIAIELINDGVSIYTISRTTGLSRKYIAELSKKGKDTKIEHCNQ